MKTLKPSPFGHGGPVPSGFTLLELLLTIAVIAILAALLLPSLGRANYSCRRISCLSNIRQQYLSQLVYAEDFQGRFAPHADQSPEFHRTPATSGDSIVNVMRGAYLKDTSILICPITRVNFGRSFRNFDSMGKYATEGVADYGGWDTAAPWVYTPYMWLANLEPTPRFVDPAGMINPEPSLNEPPWPTRMTECSSRSAFVTHRISKSPNCRWWDLGHMGRVGGTATARTDFGGWFVSWDQPVGRADGSGVIRKNALLRPRAIGGFGGQTIYYY